MDHRATAHGIVRPAAGRPQKTTQRAVHRGEMVRLLPGVYGPVGSAASLIHRAVALRMADPDAVITGSAAARLTWWPELAASSLTAVRRRQSAPAAGFVWERRGIPAELIDEVGGLRFTSPALTVLDLIGTEGGRAIDEALRRRAVALAQLWQAFSLTPGRPGNAQRRALLEDSRDAPWSEAERLLHRYLREQRLPWRYATNCLVHLTNGRRAFLDAAIPALRLYFEADGFEYHHARSAFEHDRDRDTDLASQGWEGHRFTASFLEHQPDETRRRIRSIVERRARHFGLA